MKAFAVPVGASMADIGPSSRWPMPSCWRARFERRQEITRGADQTNPRSVGDAVTFTIGPQSSTRRRYRRSARVPGDERRPAAACIRRLHDGNGHKTPRRLDIPLDESYGRSTVSWRGQIARWSEATR